MGSFLGTAAATAAGVAGGAFLFHGLSNLLGDQDGAGAAASAQDASASSFADAGGQDGASQLENQFGESAGLDDAQPADAGWADDPLADAGGAGDLGGDFGGGDFGGDFSSDV